MITEIPVTKVTLPVLFCSIGAKLALADGELHKVNHIIIVMQENHSFDNYFGVLAYAPGSPYHNANGSCLPSDHACVDACHAQLM